MKNLSDQINKMQKNRTIFNKNKTNPNNTLKEKNTEILENENIRQGGSEKYEIPQNLNICEKKSSKSAKNYNLSQLEKSKNDGFAILDDEKEKNLFNILGDDFKFTENIKTFQIAEKSPNVINEVDLKNLDFFPNKLFSDDENEEKKIKIIDFSEEEDSKEIKNDLKLITKNTNTIKKSKNKKNNKQKISGINNIYEQGQNIKNDNNNNNNEDVNQSYLAKGWEDFSFLEKSFYVNDNQNQKELINNSNISNNKNILVKKEWKPNIKFPINSNINNENLLINNFRNFGNCNYFMGNKIQNNSIEQNQIFQNQYNNQFNLPQNPYFQNLNLNNIIIQNLINQNSLFQCSNFMKSISFDNLNLINQPNKKIINKNNLIDIINIKLGLEKRTTIRMMNIPTHFTTSELSKRIDQRFKIDPKKENRTYNYIYVPGSMKSASKNLGFAFINFVHPLHIIKFYEYYHKRNLRTYKSNKVCLITFADKQKMEGNFGDDINPYGNYLIFNDTKNHFLLFEK